MLAGRVIEQQFSREALAQVNHIVQTIKEEYSMAIEGSTLFSDATKAEALAKLKNMRFYVGYPGAWKDCSTLKVAPDDLVGNARAIARFDHEFMVAKLSQPVDLDEWLQSPTVVNAYYQPSANKFVLLGAILQPPFFDAAWDDAAQFGGIGFIIGHEIGHGFDDQGSQFDAEGNLRNWWAAADRKKSNAVAARAVAQANAYEILPGHFLNGELELGEILGDLNGLHIAYRAYRRIMSTDQDPQQADRTFFEQAAKVWRSNLRQPILLKFLETDGHPPGEYRVNGIFPHLDAFHTLYQTQPGDGMYLAPKDRLKIW
ncbi:M13 family metallopeptidase [Photobacterium sp. MCCC 1A19761]|uniref:M13 family metallopeptidase n=1 Tax=Photobacterium sp. MCCC 1A19761 TaxID=3115000 RepID=UPI00307E2602